MNIIQNHYYFYNGMNINININININRNKNPFPFVFITNYSSFSSCYRRRRIAGCIYSYSNSNSNSNSNRNSNSNSNSNSNGRRIRRRTNHLRKKLQKEQEQVHLPSVSHPPCIEYVVDNEYSSSSITSSSSIELNPVLVNQFQTCIPNKYLLINPKLGGISLLFSAFLLFIAFTTTTTKTQKDTTTRFEKEMLTRKYKARMAKLQNTTTTVDVILPPPEMSPPQLDKQQLINTILLNSNSSQPRILNNTITSSPTNTQPTTTHHNANSHLSIPENDTQPALDNTEQLLQNKPTPSTATATAGRIITSVKEARQYLHNKKHPNIPNTFNLSATSNDTSLGENENVSINNSEDEKQESVNAKETGEELERANREKWMEDNFHEFQPIVDKIRAGFSNNYMLAKQKVKEDSDDIVSDLKMLQRDHTETEFEWMKDEKLTEIVFQVRENELMGRDPFYLMDNQDKALFFKGLEKNVEKENQKLCQLHEYLHSNIENLDYGADGISLYDPPEKIIPRWKGPPPATTMSEELLDDYLHQRKALFAETLGNSDLVKTDPQDSLQGTNKTVESKNLKSSKTVIEGSDGSVKPGKKSGKEFWQHTKKWSRGFIDSYNAENDPETKAVMKDIGKDLDRWITEKEIQATADIMDKVPVKGKKFITEKINKLKTEMELFGPQAVVSKYSEYGEEEEEIDYYWWLDLPFLLCIELYIEGDEDERIGFYSLEMASDLELDPKPHHIIAFEDAGDCKNFCYIINAHMEMLGNGNAFVVPQLPKDTYQEAKTNGFNVTVIRKGELKLDVDQTLEEVEEKLVEIGSKIYHDKIMKGRNVDVNSVMKGVFGLNKQPKRSRSRKKLKKPTK